ncbi:DUF1501 domain-containing protein [Lentisphaera profundi]|uniref:DUF1501 domain-containing protein n=1 Tax=Lentisphaera profundi TaxID=1658616 RepID=A0ABY7W0V2_9BACT|nr:DUF1501 domain-containing protein [Lentisphaera profundi]WDE98619.1 DUF1501 domain-containing protein [Lentisphaera profundi]
MNRRNFLNTSAMSLGALALNKIKAADTSFTAGTHFPAKAKSVIFMHMVGGPSQLDLFDHKPELKKYDDKLAPDHMFKGKRLAFITGHPKLMASPYKFEQCGQSGQWISDRMPHLKTVADELCFVKSMHTEDFNHAPAQLAFHTGLNRNGNPGLGSWMSYGLGSANKNLPPYVVMVSGQMPGAGSALWNNAFLPSVHQGVELRSKGDPILFLNNPKGMTRAQRSRIITKINSLNQQKFNSVRDPEISTRMAQYELAQRMQSSVPEINDLSTEPEHIRKMYGDTQFGRHCLLARRLVEKGVRFVELFNADWDHHLNLNKRLNASCAEIDQAQTALIMDLKQRGLLADTLVVWGGEFGRTPLRELRGGKPENGGRDHHKEAFTVWMAGGGVKGGMSYGATDELGYGVVDKKTHVRDLHATIMKLMGLDHKKVSYKFKGLDQRLTGVEESHIIKEIIS